MRISNNMIHAGAIARMGNLQSQVSEAENEVSSGKKITKPSDDPVAAARILELERQQANNTQYGENISALQTRLQTADTTLGDVDSVVQQIQSLAVQANNGTLSASDKQNLATQITELEKQLMDLANTKDSNGDYLFSGYSTSTQPFARDSSGNVTYSGDQNARSIQVSSSQYMSDVESGYTAFMSVPSGNGVFALSAASGNTGSGVISGTIQDRSSWVDGDYTLSFTSASDWQVTDSSGNVVTSGTGYEAGNAITFNGVSLSVTGTPAAGDSFQVSSSTKTDIFATIDALVSALNSSTDTAAQQAQYQNTLNSISDQLGQAENQILNVRSSVGARESALDSVETSRQNAADQLTSVLSDIRDSDYTEAVSRYSQLYTALEAAQQAYSKTAQLSLFDYLK